MKEVANEGELGDGSARPFDFLPDCAHRAVILRFREMRVLVIIILGFLALAITLRPHQFAPLPTKPMPAVSLPDK
jgi:hypothetical protein